MQSSKCGHGKHLLYNRELRIDHVHGETCTVAAEVLVYCAAKLKMYFSKYNKYCWVI